ncbi:KUP/HAK/KT family potassium transporter [Flagellimonas crocea]|uniref:KUP/HAK/KT family potassium transporter n=1 Tax=Flagellimonas crocea TaxID=3067311 RepID=UPI00296F2ECA|nr:KUP/HAK/KT family potassium transporter [Muricauda sp. DH64]
MMRGNFYKVAPSALLVTLGIVFGDIGTSPLYVFTAITKGTNFGPELILDSPYYVFWTLMPIATIKYVLLAWNADNQRKGGVFFLYALLKKTAKSKWISYPILIGCVHLIYF